MSAMEEIAAERRRQIEVEGWTPEHDIGHDCGELVSAAICYAEQARSRGWVSNDPAFGPEYYARDPADRDWPWATDLWKPKNPRRDLIRAAALIVAEIERLDRAEPRP
jgi:hypothetical protein